MRTVRRRSIIVLSVATAVFITGVVAGGWGSAPDRSSTARRTIAINDVHLAVPAGWRSESFVNRSGMSVFRIGSFEFRHAEDDDVGQVAQAAMGPADVLINIIDVTATDPGTENLYYQRQTLPLAMSASRAVQQEGYRAPAAIIEGVRINGHNLYVSVAFGTAPPTQAQVSAARAVLRTLVVR